MARVQPQAGDTEVAKWAKDTRNSEAKGEITAWHCMA
jgi:hypothetical protein